MSASSLTPGRFITVEGADGAGKSTQLQTIQQWLSTHQIASLFSREPGGTPIGEQLRKLLLGEGEFDIGDDTELLMVFAARAQHLDSVIKPAINKGQWVVSDRFTDASYAYQGARGISSARIAALEAWVQAGLQPDLTLLFDLPVEAGLARVNQRGDEDRFEQESLAYKKKVREIYLQRAEQHPERIKVIDSSRSIESVSEQVVAVLDRFVS